jgi:Spy/CpxP family protein refolding chaperone
MKLRTLTFLLAVLLLQTVSVKAQEPQNGPPPDDPIQHLRLTPEQRQRIRIIMDQTKDERQMVNRRLREANQALDRSLDADPLDDNVVEQRLAELNAAQSANLRLRVTTEIRIRKVLTSEQLAVLANLHLQLRDFVNGPRPNPEGNPGRRPDGQPGLRPNQSNGIAPMRPRRDNPPPNPRPDFR